MHFFSSDEKDHERHHQFIRNHLEMYNHYIKLYCFGEKYIGALVRISNDILKCSDFKRENIVLIGIIPDMNKHITSTIS